MRSLLLLVVAASCAVTGESVRTKHVQTASVGYDIPEDWERVESTMRGVETSIWTPKENSERMSVTVIRSELSPTIAAADAATINQLLIQAQGGLRNAKLSPVAEISTAQGLKGARIELEYLPPEVKARYHRSHVVLVDGTALVHVLFTAQSPNTFAAFETVLSSIRHEEVHQ